MNMSDSTVNMSDSTVNMSDSTVNMSDSTVNTSDIEVAVSVGINTVQWNLSITNLWIAETSIIRTPFCVPV